MGTIRPVVFKVTPPPPSDEIVIGTQTWKKYNLAVNDGGTGIQIVDNVIANGVNFGTQYYYTYEAANRVASNIPGWHIPTLTEYNALSDFLGGWETSGKKLKSTEGWNNNGNGTDDYGFSGFPAGRYNISGVYSDFSNRGRFHTSTEVSGGKFYTYTLYYGSSTLSYVSSDTSYCYSVRLVKDI
jgi:uncharacterized protein (TIGR02145 family)